MAKFARIGSFVFLAMLAFAVPNARGTNDEGFAGAAQPSAPPGSKTDLLEKPDQPKTAPADSSAGRVASLTPDDLRDFSAQPPAVQKLLAAGLGLTARNLTYNYGSSDPANGGMDCSGTVYFLLRQAGIADVPRDAGGMYRWVWEAGLFRAVNGSRPDTFELERLRPGDLLFWTGTYRAERDPPVTHVMIYLGLDRHTGARAMLGASEGRRFRQVSRYGVSVFDFTIPRPAGDETVSGAEARFIGYASVPGLAGAR